MDADAVHGARSDAQHQNQSDLNRIWSSQDQEETWPSTKASDDSYMPTRRGKTDCAQCKSSGRMKAAKTSKGRGGVKSVRVYILRISVLHLLSRKILQDNDFVSPTNSR